MQAPTRPEIDLTVRCSCGAVSLHAKGIVRSMFMCACEDCQASTGTGHAAIVLMRAADVTVSGATSRFARPAESGAELTRWFCPTCGTPVYAQSSRASTLVNIPVGLFGAAAADWFKPNQLIFARSHREWDVVAADLPRHDTYRQTEPS